MFTSRLVHTAAKAALGGALALMLGSAALAADIVVKHAQGETTVPQNPSKVVTFDYAALDTLDALGVDIIGLPGTNLPEYLSKYSADTYFKLGSI
ncbi:MAG TPA: hypothetical protein VFE52_05950, partial [Devosia sp.]|nr:hypothetical protein [Devosia sp.]